MAESVDFTVAKSLVVRRQRDLDGKLGCTGERHLIFGPVGASGPNQIIYRTLLQFTMPTVEWNKMASITKIEFGFRTATNVAGHETVGGKPRLWFDRLTSGFAVADAGAANEDTWVSGDYAWPTIAGKPKGADFPINSLTGKPQDAVFVWVDVTAQVRPVVPKSIKVTGIGAGLGAANYGFVIRAPEEERSTAQRGVGYSGDPNVAANNRPLLRVTFEPKNLNPDAPTLLAPATTGVSFSQSFEGQHSDPDFDPMDSREIKVWQGTTSTEVWPKGDTSYQRASSDETATGRFVVPISLTGKALKFDTAYEWQARTKANVGDWGTWSARRALRLNSLPPSVTATNLGSIPDLASVHFGGTYSDPESNPLYQFHIQMQPTTGLDWNNPDRNVWDTGEISANADEINAVPALISRQYAGRPIPAGNYTYRIRVQDSTLAWSLAWSEDAFTLTEAYELDPGAPDLETTQMNRLAPARIALFNMGTSRGPGTLIGYVDDPINLGATRYLNGGGEMYFSLPALHPYCPAIEPHQVHYQVQQYYGDRYRSIFSGLITDFDADPDTVTFYGTDYLGLLQTAVDERFDPKNAEKAADNAGGGGSKYINQSIDTVIKDQLLHHKNKVPNSPVAFIAIAPPTRFAALTEKVTIYSTYSEALPFILGLLDSHKQGTGAQIRFWDRALTDDYKTFEWALVDNWGKDRKNIRLEYGGLLNDFQVIALGDFGTQVLAIGQKRGEVKVYRASGKVLLPEAKWGRRVKTRFYQDIIDQADLNRRAAEATAELSKVGKRMALAIKADSLQPFDGWDLGDRIAIDIKRGVVDTALYGSGGMWTILGVEWRYDPDGHTDLTLTISPKQTSTPPDPDLIRSAYPGVPIEFQTGHGVPVAHGEPPIATPEPGALMAASITPLVLGPEEQMQVAGTPPIAGTNNDGSYTLGERFQVLADGQITAFRAYIAGDCTLTTRPFTLWSDTGTLLLTVNSTETPGTTRWVTVPLPTPFPVTAGTFYRIAYAYPLGPGGTRIHGNASAVVGSTNLVWNQGVYDLAGVANFPASGSATVTYFADVVYQSGTPDAPPSGLPLDTDPVLAATYQDLNSGCIYELDQELFDPPGDPGENPNPDFNTYHEVYCPISAEDIPPPTGDTEPPPVPVIKSASSELVVQEDGSSLTGLFATVGYVPPAADDLADLAEFVLQSTRYTAGDPPTADWTRAQQRVAMSADADGSDTIIVHVPVVSATPYHLRVAAIDVSGNRSDWSDEVTVTSAADDKAPPRPDGVVIASGMATVGLRWNPINADDFAYTEVQYRRAAFAGAPEIIADPDADPPIEAQPALPPYPAAPEWVSIHTAATLVVLTGLANGDGRDPKAIDVRLRSVDWSGNTKHDTGTLDGEGNPITVDVKVADNDEMGWVTKDADGVTLVGLPSALPADTLLWTEAMIEDLFAGEINATWITSGTLRVGNAPLLTDEEKEQAEAGPPRIEVYDADGTLVGRWGTEGIEVMDPDNSDYKLVITNAGLSIWNDWTQKDPVTGESIAWESVRLTPQGIDAASITFGSMRGGHNLIQNSSFEMGDFELVTLKNSGWDTNLDWNAAGSRQGTDINITVGTSVLSMTSVT